MMKSCDISNIKDFALCYDIIYSNSRLLWYQIHCDCDTVMISDSVVSYGGCCDFGNTELLLYQIQWTVVISDTVAIIILDTADRYIWYDGLLWYQIQWTVVISDLLLLRYQIQCTIVITDTVEFAKSDIADCLILYLIWWTVLIKNTVACYKIRYIWLL